MQPEEGYKDTSNLSLKKVLIPIVCAAQKLDTTYEMSRTGLDQVNKKKAAERVLYSHPFSGHDKGQRENQEKKNRKTIYIAAQHDRMGCCHLTQYIGKDCFTALDIAASESFSMK